MKLQNATLEELKEVEHKMIMTRRNALLEAEIDESGERYEPYQPYEPTQLGYPQQI